MRRRLRLRPLLDGDTNVGHDRSFIARRRPAQTERTPSNTSRLLVPSLFVATLLVLSLSTGAIADGPTPPARERVYRLTAMADLACFICFVIVFVMGGRYRAVLCLGLTMIYLVVSQVLYQAFQAALGGPSNIGELPINLFLTAAFVLLTGLGLVASLVFGLLQLRAKRRRARSRTVRRRSRPMRVSRRIGLATCLLLVMAFALSAFFPFRWTWADQTSSVDRCYTFSLSAGLIGAATSYRVSPGAQRPYSQGNGFDFRTSPRLIWMRLPCGQSLASGYKYRFVRVPLWAPLLASAVLTAMLWRRERRLPPPGHCRKCGYDLTANTTGICPECGTASYRRPSPPTPAPQRPLRRVARTESNAKHPPRPRP